MTTSAKKLFSPALLTASAATYYTAPANTHTILKKLTFTNTDTVARTITVYLVPSAGSASATNTLTSAQTIAPGATYECFEGEGHVLNPGDFLQALASTATVVNIQGSGVEIY